MKIDNKMCEVIADIEFIIGSECYNPNSYDGWNDIEGCDFRYPIIVPSENGVYNIVKSNINRYWATGNESITTETIKYIKYKFGANELYIGQGIIKTLEYLEKSITIDF